jgi:hypothetical protein
MYRVVAPEVAHSVTTHNVAVIGTGYVGLTLRPILTRQNYQPEYTENSLERRAQLAEEYVAVSEAELTELAEEMLAADLHGPVGSSRFDFAGLTSADPIMYAVSAYRAIPFAFVN